MEKRSWTGWGIVIVGIILVVAALEEFFIGLIFVVIGLVIAFNRKEDFIEQIKSYGGKKNRKK